MKIILSILVLIMVTGCGKAQTASEFAALVENFTTEGVQRGKEINMVPVVFVDSLDAPNSRAECNRSPFKHQVEILRSKWEQLDATFQEMLLFHELGHCVLGLEHVDYVRFNLMVTSTVMIDENDYRYNRKIFLDNLFAK